MVLGAAVPDSVDRQSSLGCNSSSKWRILPICLHVDELQQVEDAIRDAESQETDMIRFGHASLEEIRSFSKDTFAACCYG